MSGVHNLAMSPKRMLRLMVLLIDELEVNTLEEVSEKTRAIRERIFACGCTEFDPKPCN